MNNTLALFLGDRHDIKQRLVARLNEIRSKLDRSHYFKTHEVRWRWCGTPTFPPPYTRSDSSFFGLFSQIVGSSILIIYDDVKVGAWLIDFAKTRHVPENMVLNHRQPWVPGNHEEGFLFGLDHLIEVGVASTPPFLSCVTTLYSYVVVRFQSIENSHTPISKDSVATSSSIKVET